MLEVLKKADRTTYLLIVACGISAALLAAMLLHMVGEEAGSNSYALMAEGFLHGRLDVDRCFDSDCVTFDGKSYVVFPPVPAVVAMPFVAIFGPDFAGFSAIGFSFFLASFFLWNRIFMDMGVGRQSAIWLLLALAFASPLFYVSIRADRVWFFAQCINFFLLSLALHEVMRGGRLVVAGICLGLAFLCRQMTILLVPFYFVLALKAEEKLISFRWPHISRALKIGLPVAVAVGIYMAFNYARFAAPMETGYAYIAKPHLEQWSLINNRLLDHGLFSSAYFLFNAFHLFVQGFHVEWGGPNLLMPTKLDPMGTSLLAASPFVLLLYFVPIRRPVVIGGLCALLILGITLFYHGNGFSQYNTQRFVLDWAPVLFYALAATMAAQKALRPALGILVFYGVGLNLVMLGLLAVLHQA
tara:strand:- start:16122 stop:17363 length:1242 start_codon:yes stop_codon:yes gene_type:complete